MVINTAYQRQYGNFKSDLGIEWWASIANIDYVLFCVICSDIKVGNGDFASDNWMLLLVLE